MTIRDTVDLVLLAALWGASFLFMRIAGPEFGPVALVQLRVAIAALVLLPILWLRGGQGELMANWRKLALLGVVNSAIPFMLLTYATLYITGGLAAILNATAPIFTAVIAWLWLADRLDGSRIAGLLIGVAGVYVLVRDEVGLSLDDATLAVTAAIVASLCYGIGGNYTKRYTQGVRPLAIAAGSQLAAAIVLLPGAVMTWPDRPVSALAWAALVLMGVLSTGLAYILYFRLIANAGPTNAITVTYLIPAFAMLLGALLIDEVVTLTMIVGCAIILLGTALATGMLSVARFRS